METHMDNLPRYGLYIDGSWCVADHSPMLPVNESAYTRPMAYVAQANQDDVNRAVRAARLAFDKGPWPHTAPAERSRILHALADAIENRAADFAELESRNLGVPMRKSMFVDVPMAIEHFRTFAELARRSPYEPLPWIDMPTVSWNFVWREPIGVCAQIVPWNYPLLMAAWKIAPALAAGNTVILKPASYTPLTALLLAEVFHESGLLPKGVFNLLTGPGGTVGEGLTMHPDVDKVTFTGSTEVGRRIMELASASIKRVTLELGGKSPSIVLPDADLDLATDGVLFGMFFNGGQSCEAGTRCLVPVAIYREFVERLVARASHLRLGDPLDLETDIGPLVSHRQREVVERYIQIGLEEGAHVALGAHSIHMPEFEQAPFVTPTIFTEVHNKMRIAQEEIFGPVLSVIPYNSISEAIEIANDSFYGLSAALWSRDLQGAIEVAKRIRCGTIWINDYHLINPMAPFGGFKQSGVGREHGVYGLMAYTEVKHVHVDLMQKREGRVWWDVLLPHHEE